eukprot:7007264-Alexandrium_andersonii.AAC.1
MVSELAKSPPCRLQSAIGQSAIRTMLCYWSARAQRIETCEIASDLRNLNCPGPGTTQKLVPQAPE